MEQHIQISYFLSQVCATENNNAIQTKCSGEKLSEHKVGMCEKHTDGQQLGDVSYTAGKTKEQP